ncbi:hypothetical protein H7J51_18780 [Mycobacterium crocinum]|uniref:Cullin, a subunit of E3 ubiquitin ligase n=1 Tax=Mycolicibacterium crocinum TaxID=388459 RepID=A0ABY3TL88_9MYCO|nr:hypothetical protein [Mycolicibacterium crocinum]MCV7217322.1 hypothetical protein [Mycolicibacterium crocinum]ULN42221.1 hypothetical protein MI149_03565 [Mycolicibacterium crocinum]
MQNGGQPFVGSEALACGLLNRHQLRTRYRAVFPDVYISRETEASVQDRIAAAWLWSSRNATIAGLSAAAVLGAKWISADDPVELIHDNPRPPSGVITRRLLVHSDEVQAVGDWQVTTPARTAFDIGRHGNLRSAVARLDALARATKVSPEDVLAVAARHRGSRGLRQLESALDLVDRGAESPQETYLRLLLIRGGLPRPTTQIPVYGDDGNVVAYLDMGWPELLVGVEYDGDQHRSDRRQYLRDIRRRDVVEDLGWRLLRVVAEDHPMDILRRARRAIAERASTVR